MTRIRVKADICISYPEMQTCIEYNICTYIRIRGGKLDYQQWVYIYRLAASTCVCYGPVYWALYHFICERPTKEEDPILSKCLSLPMMLSLSECSVNRFAKRMQKLQASFFPYTKIIRLCRHTGTQDLILLDSTSYSYTSKN